MLLSYITADAHMAMFSKLHGLSQSVTIMGHNPNEYVSIDINGGVFGFELRQEVRHV